MGADRDRGAQPFSPAGEDVVAQRRQMRGNQVRASRFPPHPRCADLGPIPASRDGCPMLPSRGEGQARRAPSRPLMTVWFEDDAHSSPRPRPRRHLEELRPRAGQPRREPVGRGGYDPRHRGRERRRQVDADVHRLRLLRGRRRRDPREGRAGPHRLLEGLDPPRHRHGPPALHAGRHAHRARQRHAGRRGRRAAGAGAGAVRARWRARPRLRPRRRPRRARRRPRRSGCSSGSRS